MHKFKFAIKIPEDTKMLVNLGEEVKLGQALGEYSQCKLVEVEITSPLGVKADSIGKHLKVAIGQEVDQNTVLAAHSSGREIKSPASGVVQKISDQRGLIYLKAKTQQNAYLSSPVFGTITAMDKTRIEIEVTGKLWEGLSGIGDTKWGNVSAVGEWGTVKIDQLNSDHGGQIVIIADKINDPWLAKASALEVAGVVCPGLTSSDVSTYGVSLIIMPPDENNQMEKGIWTDLVKQAGKMGMINPVDKIFGVMENRD